MIKDKEELYKKLATIVKSDNVKMDKSERLLYSRDLTPLSKDLKLVFKLEPDAVVRPRNALDVSDIVKLACKERIPVIPRGGASWGLGGAIPATGGIVLDMRWMNHIIRLDKTNMEVEVEAGATWKNLYDAAISKGLLVGSYPSSAPGATIAGWINTGGVGIGSYKYGSVGKNILNMEVVLPEGQIIETGFDKVSDYSSGYNLNGLFIGSEGTLGIITKVTMKAYPAPDIIKPISVQFKTLREAIPLMNAITKANDITPLNVLFSDEKHVAHLKQLGKKIPGDGALVNIALEGSRVSVRVEEKVLDKLIESSGGLKLSDEDAVHEWNERFYEFEARKTGICTFSGEIVVPISKFSNVIKETNVLLETMNMEGSIMGMLGDRNTVALLPYFFFGGKNMKKSMMSLSFYKKFGDIGFSNDGRPLGFGLFFATNIKKVRGKDAVNTMFDIKSALDPYDILNPGKTLEGISRCGAPIPEFAIDLGMNAAALGKSLLPKDRSFQKSVERREEKSEGEPKEDV